MAIVKYQPNEHRCVTKPSNISNFCCSQVYVRSATDDKHCSTTWKQIFLNLFRNSKTMFACHKQKCLSNACLCGRQTNSVVLDERNFKYLFVWPELKVDMTQKVLFVLMRINV